MAEMPFRRPEVCIKTEEMVSFEICIDATGEDACFPPCLSSFPSSLFLSLSRLLCDSHSARHMGWKASSESSQTKGDRDL